MGTEAEITIVAQYGGIWHAAKQRYLMATMNISVPDQMKAWVENHIAEGQFSDASDFMRDLIRKAQFNEAERVYYQAAADAGFAGEFEEIAVEDILPGIKKRTGHT
jgi:antitoxin ParD1/3/4